MTDPDLIGYDTYRNNKLVQSVLFEIPPVFVYYWSGDGEKFRIELRNALTSPLYDAEQRLMIP